jgi:tetratricopeptide (TPR) repeat protein
MGMVSAWRRKTPGIALPIAFVAQQAIVVALFFVTARYRTPSLPFFAIFACAGAVDVWNAVKDRRFAIVGALVALAIVLQLPAREANVSYAAELDFYRGLAYLRNLRDPPSAVERFRRAATEDPSDARIWFELGNALDAARRSDEAIDAWKHADAADPTDPRAARRAAVVLTLRGDLDAAIVVLQADVDAHARDDATYAQDHLNLAILRARRRDFRRALDDLAIAANEDPRYFRASLVAWTRTALDQPAVDDAAFWIAVGDRVREVDPSIATLAWRRAAASTPTAEQVEALRTRLGEGMIVP